MTLFIHATLLVLIMNIFSLPNELIYQISFYADEYIYFLRQTCRFFRNNLPSVPVLAYFNRIIKDGNVELTSFFNLTPLYERPLKRRFLGAPEYDSPSRVAKLANLAIKENYFHIFLWLGYIPEKAKETASGFGRVSFLEFLERKDDSKPNSVAHSAALNGKIESLLWLKEHDYPLQGSLDKALSQGYLETAQILLEMGVHWTNDGIKETIIEGRVDSFNFLLQNGLNLGKASLPFALEVYLDIARELAKDPKDENLINRCRNLGKIVSKIEEIFRLT